MKKKLIVALLFCLSFTVHSLELSFRVTPGVLIPSGNFDAGFCASAQLDVDLFGFLTAGVEGILDISKPSGVNDSVNIYGGGLGAGAYYFPLSRLYLGAGASFGIYNFSTKIDGTDKSASDLYWRGYGEAGFRVSPLLTVNAVGGWNSFMVSGSKNLIDGAFIGVGAKLSFSTKSNSSSGIRVSLEQDSPVFPLYMGAYQNAPVGTLTVRNNEGADIKDVHISFRAGKYTESTFECANFSKMRKYKSVEVPLYANFGTELLKFSENGKISGEIVIDYDFLGSRKQSVQSVVLDVYNRNAFIWNDASGLASFISPSVPEIHEFAKYVAGIARNDFRTGINRNLEMAAYMFEGLRLSKIECNSESTTPYESAHLSADLDLIQYPLQTMNVLGGDCDEVGILFASCLESVGVGTGFIALDDDFIVLVSLGIQPGSARNNFADVSGLIVDKENVYFGISMKNIKGGFTKARNEAFKKIAKILSDENASLEYTDTNEAWQIYAPALYTGSSGLFEKAAESQIEKGGKQAVNDYINSEIEGVIENARKSGDPNRIGLAYVRVGRYAEARAQFSKSDTLQGMNNLANVYLIEKNFSAAKSTFDKVLQKDPENKTALKGLEKIKMMQN